MEEQVTVKDVQNYFQLEVIFGENHMDREITVSDLHRPGLELAGFLSYHPVERFHLLGRTELALLDEMGIEEREERLHRFCNPKIPGICVTRNLSVPKELIAAAERHQVPILRTNQSTTKFSSKLTYYLEKFLAPRTTIHGVLVEVYGVGVLMVGKSGIGKSEAALELVKRGHRLVADDAVEIIKEDEERLTGYAPELIRNLVEIRGLGIMNVMTLFGAGAVRKQKKVSLVIRLENWQENYQYDRLGLDEELMTILDVEVPMVRIPVRPGRNIAVIIEVAAMNYRLKLLGQHAAKEFVERLGNTMDVTDDEFD